MTDLIVAVSADEMHEGLEAGVRCRYEIIPNAINEHVLQRILESSHLESARSSHLTVVTVARLCKQKGQDVLLAAWREVSTLRPDARLILIGDGPYQELLNWFVNEHNLPNVTFAHAQSDVAPWLARANIYVSSSRWEAGLSLSVMEAMAAGLPIVTTATAGSSRGLPVECGTVVPINDAHALAQAITARLEDDELRLTEGARGRAHAVSSFGWQLTSARHVAAYETILSKSAF